MTFLPPFPPKDLMDRIIQQGKDAKKNRKKGKYSRKDSQRPGQALINYIRFVKGVMDDHFVTHMKTGSITSHKVENYIWNMTEKEFEEALDFDWEKDREKVKKEFRE